MMATNLPKERPSGSASQWVSESLEPRGCLGATVSGVGIALILGTIALLGLLWLMSGQPEDLAERKLRLQNVQLEPLIYAEGPIRLEDLQRKVVVLNFWGTWCPPCLMELPHLAELEQKYRARKEVLFLAVSCGPGPQENIEEIRSDTSALLANQQIAMPTYVDPGWVTRNAVAQAVGFRGYPTTLLLDQQGYIRRIWVGFNRRMPKELDRAIEELLAENP
ncbi:MAG: TlpA family protein disulfide reductase [Thermoguttaceae bacterium]|nr:TlpA family protein disulfide reductase [Thermoguttaceae bacterium]MDW8039023.1 TlpA disulfide reductase family protein [Thermoguttaceae bacterium]